MVRIERAVDSMTKGLITFIICWLFFCCFSNKKKFPLFVLTGYVGLILALSTDLLMHVYSLWYYPGTPLEQFGINMMNALGIYFVVIYFFLQALPKKQTFLTMVRYIFYWSIIVIIIELVFLSVGYIRHGLWWNIGTSYVVDWVLFTIFYVHHKWISNSISKCYS